MSNINQIQVDNTTYDVQAKALDSTLDATILHKSELVNGFTQTTAAVNALDAAAGKTLNDTLKNFKTDSTLTTTIDTMLDNGFYAMNGSSAVGTFPDSTGKYGVLQSIKRGSGTFQFLYASGNLWAREVGSSVGTWTNLIDAKIDSRLPFYFYFFTISGSGSKVITAPNSTSIWILWANGNNSTNGIASMRLVDSNNANFATINAGAGNVNALSASWVTSTGKLTLTNGVSGAMRCFVFSEKELTV